jgi:murein DD-endopeptidase MepM/ murein hydrolase activator NlpD
MASKEFRTVIDEREWQRYRERVARGALNFGYAVEADAKADAPVRGGHRSFAPDGPIGGTLRRSIHTAAFLDGIPVPGSAATDENGEPIPVYPIERGIVVVVGTNSGYGLYVEAGTYLMDARPFLAPAWDGNLANAESLILAGAG